MAFSFLEFPIYAMSHCTPCPNEPRSPLQLYLTNSTYQLCKMLIDNHRHIHIYKNSSANMLSVIFSIVLTSPIYKGAGAVSVPAKK